MSWRPEGWANPHPTRVAEYIGEKDISHPDPAYDAYEASADAMLELLKAEGYRTELFKDVRSDVVEISDIPILEAWMDRVDYGQMIQGWFVFIPEEQP